MSLFQNELALHASDQQGSYRYFVRISGGNQPHTSRRERFRRDALLSEVTYFNQIDLRPIMGLMGGGGDRLCRIRGFFC